ncbi:hypothetical protein Tco_0811113 [Tanacetum coccineum]
MLKRCEDTNLALNWEKSHFMVKEGIVLGHKISKSGIEVDRAKIDVIAKLPHPTTVKVSVDFLGNAWNPHKNELDPKEINENFPLETLSSIAALDSSTLWFAGIANYHAANFVIKLFDVVFWQEVPINPHGCHDGQPVDIHGANYNTRKVFDSVFFCPQSTKDTHRVG